MKPPKLPNDQPTIPFTAQLSPPAPTGRNGTVAVILLPKSASGTLAAREATIVEGVINCFPFRTTIQPSDGTHLIRVNKALQAAAAAEVGEDVAVEITRVGDEPELRVPADFRAALAAASPDVQALWTQITPMSRRDWVLWITTAKQEKTRAHRIETACDMMKKGKRRPCCMPGISWRMKDSDITPEETWQPLPGAKGKAKAKS
jgi:hypothetical protein